MIIDYSKFDMAKIFERVHGQLSHNQRKAVAKIRDSKALLFEAWMGLGKTFPAITASLVFKSTNVLIICNKAAVPAWTTEFKKWFPEIFDPKLFVFVDGDSTDRELLWRSRANFHICLPQVLQRDYNFLVRNKLDHYDFIIIDEAHKLGLRNRKSVTFDIIKKLREVTKAIMILTGTATRRGVPQLWGYLHILDRKKFPAYWPFINLYCVIHSGMFGKEIIGVKNTEHLAQVSMPYILKVSEAEASAELPPLRRIRLPARFDDVTAKHYRSMAESLYIELADRVESSLSVMASYMRLRQLICCPQIIDPSLSVGSAISAVCEKILENDDEKHFKHNVIFTPFIPSIEPFHNYMAQTLQMPKSDILILKGGDDPTHVKKVEDIFRANRETAVICSLKFAQSFNLETGMNAYFPHFEWDVDDNKQAEARLRRKTSDSSRTIMSYYVDMERTITDSMFDIIDQNLTINNMTYEKFQAIRDKLIEQKIP